MTALGGQGKVRTPDRPGPGPIPEALLRTLDLKIGRRIDGLLAGEHRTAMIGVGTELAQIREWEPGDDIRRIDWNATARTGGVQVRVDVAERALTSWIVLDVSPSMTFGTADRRKWDVAEGVALAAGHLGSRRGNRVGAVTFGGSSDLMLPPRQGRAGLLGVLRAVREDPEFVPAGATSVGAALGLVGRLAKQRALVVVVSDFRGPRDWRAPLLRLSARHAVVAVEIRDAREQELPNVGHLWLVDPETGRRLQVDTGRRRIRERFATAAAEERDRARAGAERRSACLISCCPPPATGSGTSRDSSTVRRPTMTFATPFLLWGLLLIPLAALVYLWSQRRRIKYAARFTNLDLLANVVAASPGRRRHLPPIFALAALAALLVALARPQMVVAVPRDQATVVLAMDSSASMTATDVEPTRLDAAKSAASSFLDKLPARFRVGLVSFSSGASVLEEPTEDREAVSSSLEGLEGRVGTAIGDAILASVQLAPEEDPQAPESKPLFAVLLLSDGANSAGIDPIEAVEVAKEAGVPVYTIALGTRPEPSTFRTSSASCGRSRSPLIRRRSDRSPRRPAGGSSRRRARPTCKRSTKRSGRKWRPRTKSAS